MEIIGAVFTGCYDVMSIPFTVFGFTTSLWQVFMYTGVAGVVLGFIWEAFFGG